MTEKCYDEANVFQTGPIKPANETNFLLNDFKERLKGQGSPCLMTWDKERSSLKKSGYGDLSESILSASALWNRSLEKRHLMRRIGLRPGDIWIDECRGSEQLINFLACLSGKFVFCARNLPKPLGGKYQKVRVAWDRGGGNLECNTAQVSSSFLSDQSFAVLLHTSGTTRGLPRTVKLDAAMLRHQLKAHSAILNLKADSNRLVFLPGFHSFGLILDRLLGLYSGQNLIFYPDQFFHPSLLLKLVRDFEIEWIALVPRTLQLLNQFLKRGKGDLNMLRALNIHSGGSYLDQAQRELWHQRLCSFWWGYGLTECGPGVLLNGRPVGSQVRLVPEKSISNQERSCEIWVKSPSLGSWQEVDEITGDAVSSDSKLKDGYYPTGDVGWQTDQGTIEVIGRIGDSFKSATGQWIHLREIEDKLVNDLPLHAAHLRLLSIGAAFELRILADLPVALRLLHGSSGLEARLQSLLSIPCKVVAFVNSPLIMQQLASIGGKSLSESLLQISPSFAYPENEPNTVFSA